MRKVDDGEKKRKEKRKEKNVVFSGLNDDRWNAVCLCQKTCLVTLFSIIDYRAP